MQNRKGKKQDATPRPSTLRPLDPNVMRHLALNLIRKESESKFSVPRKRRKASLYDEYREKVLGI